MLRAKRILTRLVILLFILCKPSNIKVQTGTGIYDTIKVDACMGLMKLNYRQTRNNCYEIIEDYKGSFNASFWQTIALIFGSNLRQNYDPNGNEQVMEMIVKDVEKMYGVKG